MVDQTYVILRKSDTAPVNKREFCSWGVNMGQHDLHKGGHLTATPVMHSIRIKMWPAQNSLEERLDSLDFPENVPVDPWGHYFKLPRSILYMNTAILMHSRQLIHFVGRSATTRSCDPRIRPVLARCARHPPGFLGPAVVLWLWGSMCNHLQFVIRRGRVLIQLWSARWVNFFCSLYIACLWVWLTSGPGRQQKVIAQKNCWFGRQLPQNISSQPWIRGKGWPIDATSAWVRQGFPEKFIWKRPAWGSVRPQPLGVPVLGVSALCEGGMAVAMTGL
jgi:hypothetical protein